MQGLKRTAFSGPALVRLLADFADIDVHEPAQSLSDRLSQWLGWTDAIALSTALATAPPAASRARAAANGVEEDCARNRMRRAVSRALGYEMTREMDYGLEMPADTPAAAAKGPYAMLFHATSSEEKKWPVADWISVGSAIAARGLRVLVPWGNDAERKEAETIAASVPGAEVMPRLSITGVAQMVGKASLVVGMDTGFVHIADALRRPTVILFTTTSRHLYGVDAPGRAVSLGGGGVVPQRAQVLAAIEEVLPKVTTTN